MNNPLQLISQLEKQLSSCMLVDRFSIKRRLQRAKDLIKQNKPAEKMLTDIAHNVQSSAQRFAQRLAKLPKPEYPLELPVSSRRDEIAKAIERDKEDRNNKFKNKGRGGQRRRRDDRDRDHRRDSDRKKHTSHRGQDGKNRDQKKHDGKHKRDGHKDKRG